MREPATSIRPLTRAEWDSAVISSHDVSYRQCGSYSEAAARDVGAVAEFIGIYRSDTLIGMASVRVKTLPLAGLGIAYVHGGPLTLRMNDFSGDAFYRCIVALENEYVIRRKLVLRLVLPITGVQRAAELTACLEATGFHALDQKNSKETIVVGLTSPLDEIRRSFNGKWRGHLSRAERSNVCISKSTAARDLNLFEPLFLNLARDKGFSTRQDVAFFRHLQTDTPAAQKLVLHLAWHNDELIAGHLGSFIGETAFYLVGASNAKGRETRASYLLQWTAMEYAKSVGNRRYDLGGIDETENPGCYHFKARMKGRHINEVQYELAPGSLRGSVVHFVENSYNAYREAIH